MHGDFSKGSFVAPQYGGPCCSCADDPKNPCASCNGTAKGDEKTCKCAPEPVYTRVLFQQGRCLTDGDLNEQGALLQRELRELTRSIIGWHGSPDCGFYLKPSATKKNVLEIHPGSYFVHGLRCLTPRGCAAESVVIPEEQNENETLLAYLEAWDRDVTPLEDIRMLESSLRMADTAWRSEVRWRVCIKSVPKECPKAPPPNGDTEADGKEKCKEPLLDTESHVLKALGRPKACDRTINVRFPPDVELLGPCEPSLNSRAGNHSANALYRIEIHRGGAPCKTPQTNGKNGASPPGGVKKVEEAKPCATFKWSRNNGATIVPVICSAGRLVLDGPPRELCIPESLVGWAELLDQRGNSLHECADPYCSTPSCSSPLFYVNGLSNGNELNVQINAFNACAGKKAECGKASVEKPGCEAHHAPDAGGCWPVGGCFLRVWHHNGLVESDTTSPALHSSTAVGRLGGSADQTVAMALEAGEGILRDGAIVLPHPTNNQTQAELNRGLIWLRIDDFEICFDADSYLAGDYWLIRSHEDGSLTVNNRCRIFPGNPTEPPVRFESLHERHVAPLATRTAHDSRWMPVRRQFSPLGEPCDWQVFRCLDRVNPHAAVLPRDSGPPASEQAAAVPVGSVYAISAQDVLAFAQFVPRSRDIKYMPAQCLNFQPKSRAFGRWFGPALVRDLAGSEEEFLERVEASVAVTERERDLFVEDAREALRRATALVQWFESGGRPSRFI